MKYAPRKEVVTVTKANEDGWIHTVSGDDIPYSKGSLILKNEFGEEKTISEESFNELYAPVKVEEEPKKLSNFSYDDIVAGYEAMANLNQEEDEDYIKEMMNMKEMVSGKPL